MFDLTELLAASASVYSVMEQEQEQENAEEKKKCMQTIKIKLGKSVVPGTCACGAPSVCMMDGNDPAENAPWIEWCDLGHVYVCTNVDESKENNNGEEGAEEAKSEAKPKGQLVFDFTKQI